MKLWYLYILECSDRTLYTGITVNINDRIDAHNSGSGSRYTRGKRPVKLVFSAEFPDRSSASGAEHRVKKLTRKQKLNLINGTISIDNV